MNEHLTEDDMQWLAKLIARIPDLAVPEDSIARLRDHALIDEISGGWNATTKGILTLVNWEAMQ